jgi:hypothetical protein
MFLDLFGKKYEPDKILQIENVQFLVLLLDLAFSKNS